MGRRALGATWGRAPWVIATSLLIAACSSSNESLPNQAVPAETASSASVTPATDAAPAKTEAPSTDASSPEPASSSETTSPTSTDAPPTSTADSSVTSSTDPFVVVAPTGPCDFTPPVAEGEVTWLQDGQLRAAVNGGQPTCLVEGVDGSVAWSSDAARVLIGSTTAISASGSRQTGFDSSNGTVILSAPTGTATIGIDPATHRLIRHGSDGAVSDISFLARTDEAIYHPGGKRIVAVGTSDSGEYGIWLSTNVGTEPKQILSVDDPTTPVTNVSFSADGTTLYFIHGFVHQLLVSNGLILNEIGQADRQEANLVVSKISNDEAWTIGPCDASGSVLMASPALREPIDIRTVAGSPFADSSMTLVPVGWLTDSRLVFAARTSGCDGPADIWVWAVGDTFRQVAHDASSASVRIPRGPFMDLPEVIEQAAPG